MAQPDPSCQDPPMVAIPSLQRAAYRTQQISMLGSCLAAHHVLRFLVRKRMKQPSPELQRAIRTRYDELLARDLRNAEEGLYPSELLFQMPVREYARRLPDIVRDFPRTFRRVRSQDWRDLPDGVPVDRYPPYYRRNFHWQTDGYFSRRSARIYDVGVEFLFLGTADIMRRQVIPPITRFLRDAPREETRVLDVACGTGRTLLQLAAAHPSLRYFGLDLSPQYLAVARDVLEDVDDVSLVAENAESMPFRDGYFDVATSVYLFHELPRRARRNVVREMLRVLRPGGLLVLEDSAQRSESAAITPLLERFAVDFHEPFYRDYLGDDLEGIARDTGFTVGSVDPCFVSKIVIARKP